VTITKWAPFRAFTELEQEMHTLLDHFGARPWLEGFGWRPDTDISREGSTLVIEMDLPGIDPDRDVHVDLVDNVLRIEGERCESWPVNEADRYIHERRCGCFHRNVMLPDGVRAEAIRARYENGTLIVRIPVPEVSVAGHEHHQIPIRIAEGTGT
jgi:HSP20 family molecular chaperone IbpA